MSQLRATQKRDIAEKMLAWLDETGNTDWNHSTQIVHLVAENIGEPPYNVWKAYDLLRALGRIQLNSPNGKKGGYVVDFTPLTKPVDSNAVLCKADACPILKAIKGIFP